MADATTVVRRRRPAVAPVAPAQQVTVVSRANETLTFDITGISVTFANALRRTIMEYVETVAFKGHPSTEADITITANTGVIINEEIMERMSLVPIHVSEPWNFDPSAYEFRIDVTNTNTENGLYVTSADIEVRRGTEDWHTAEEFFKPDRITGDHVIIARLPAAPLSGSHVQRLALTARASVNTGITHASYIPAVVTYEYVMEDDSTPVGRDRLQATFDKWIHESKKTNMLTTDEGRTAAKKQFDSMERQRVYKVNEAGEPSVFRFTVESVGPIGPAAIVARAFEVLGARISAMSGVNDTDSDIFHVEPCRTGMNGVDITIQNETHTLGSLLQFYLVKNYTEIKGYPATSGRPLTFAGYRLPHPLENAILVRLGVANSVADPREQCLRAFIECSASVAHEIATVRDVFIAGVRV